MTPVAGAGIGKLIKKGSELLNKDVKVANIAKANYDALTKLESGNASIRKAIAGAKSKKIDAKKLLSQTDLLQGSVDRTGTIRTTQEGGAVSQLQDFLKNGENGKTGPESIVSNLLEKEGKSISPADVEKYMVENINNSGIKGADKVRALQKVKDEVEGLLLEADSSGNIPLKSVHDAKTYKYSNIDYTNPASKNTDKTIARSLKELVETSTESADIKKLNEELSSHYAVLSLLEKLDGKKVQGGRLGQYFAKILGAAAGSHFGPLGTIVGSEVAGQLQGKAMSSTFKRGLGKALESSKLMKQALKKGANDVLKSESVPKVQNPEAIGTSGPKAVTGYHGTQAKEIKGNPRT